MSKWTTRSAKETKTVMVTIAIVAGLAGLTTACSADAVGDRQTGQGKGLLGGLGGNDGQGATQSGGTKPTTPGTNGGSTTSGGGTSTTASGKACYSSGYAACDSCVNAKCCTAIDACVNNSACAAIVQCTRNNMCDDVTCENYCVQQYPAGASAYRAGAQCITSSCNGSCSG